MGKDIEINLAESLEKAIQLGFVYIPPQKSLLGPKGKLLLLRNSVPLGNEFVAEIIVIEVESKKPIFCAAWGKDEATFTLAPYRGNDIKNWSDKW